MAFGREVQEGDIQVYIQLIHFVVQQKLYSNKNTLILFLKPFFKTPAHIIFYHSLYYRESACSVEYLGLIPGLGRSPRGGYGNPLQDSCLENPHGERSLATYSPQGREEGRQLKGLGISLLIFYKTKRCLSKRLEKQRTRQLLI